MRTFFWSLRVRHRPGEGHLAPKTPRRWLLSLMPTLLLLSLAGPSLASFPESDLSSRAAFLVNPATGQVLYERQADLRLPPASTTKIMTAIVVLESDAFKKSMLRASVAATRVPRSKINLRPGQTMDILDLLYSLLLSSANDASIVLAEGVGGSVNRFSDMMTRKAHELGARNSQFRNPHGLTAPGHYSTARDMALIFNHAMTNPVFREIVGTKTKTVSSVVNPKKQKVQHIALRNHNRLLWNFDGALGGKTGYTYAAQKCFVGSASRDGATLTVSVLGSRNLWRDTTRLFEYGLESHPTLALAAAPSTLLSTERMAFAQETPLAPRLTWEELQSPDVSGFILQIASFRQRERAEALRERISQSGYQAQILTIYLQNGEIMHQVRVGPYARIAEAQQVAKVIETKEALRPIILHLSADAGMMEKQP